MARARLPTHPSAIASPIVLSSAVRGVGVAVVEDGHVGYCLNREKFGDHYLFVEYDWGEGPPLGTAIPLKLFEAEPPTGDDELLEWLAAQEDEHRAEIDAAWKVILGFPPGRRPIL